MDIIVNIVLVISALVGMYLIAHKNKLGFIVFFIVEACMIYMGIKTGNYGLALAAIAYLSMNIYSYKKWKGEECNNI